jgi:hypothetical protein
MDQELETFIEEGKKRFAKSPAGEWRWNSDNGELMFYDNSIVLRRDGTANYEGYTRSETWQGSFRWEQLEDFAIRLQVSGENDWYILRYTIGAHRTTYRGLVWVINWIFSEGSPPRGFDGFAEQGFDFQGEA